MTWKKLVVGGAGAALLVGWGVTLSNCTVCNGPQCFSNEGGAGDSGGDAAKEGGGGDGGGDGGGSCSAVKPQGSITWGSGAACDMCLGAQCCALATTCANQMPVDGGSDTCTDYITCIDACSDGDGGFDQTCVDACNTTHPIGQPAAAALVSCVTQKCPGTCP